MVIAYTAAFITGLASDTKPDKVSENRLFLETDTGSQFLFNGSTYDQISGILSVKTSTGTYNHAMGTTEDDAIVITNNINNVEVTMDMSLLQRSTIVRVYNKTDTTNYTGVSEATYPDDFTSDSAVFVLNGKGQDQRITFESVSAEISSIAVAFNRVNVVRTE